MQPHAGIFFTTHKPATCQESVSRVVCLRRRVDAADRGVLQRVRHVGHRVQGRRTPDPDPDPDRVGRGAAAKVGARIVHPILRERRITDGIVFTGKARERAGREILEVKKAALAIGSMEILY